MKYSRQVFSFCVVLYATMSVLIGRYCCLDTPSALEMVYLYVDMILEALNLLSVQVKGLISKCIQLWSSWMVLTLVKDTSR